MINNIELGVVIRNIARAELSDINVLEQFGSATVHEAQHRIGQLKPYMRPIYKGKKVAGSAITVLLQPGDNWMMHVAMELIQPGDVIVAACTTDSNDGFFGDLLATSAKARGAKALIIDGGVRDIKELECMEFPVWSKSISIKGTVKNTLGSVNIPIICAGQIINPGDVIVADDDGVCVVARESVRDVVKKSKTRVSNEKAKREKLKKGVLGLDMYQMRARLEQAGLQYFDTFADYKKINK